MDNVFDGNPSIQEKQRLSPDGDRDNLVEEAATRFAELFLQQVLYNKRRREGKAVQYADETSEKSR